MLDKKFVRVESDSMEKDGRFADFDDAAIYKGSQARALNEATHNFVVEFGKDEAQVAFDLDVADIQNVLDTPREGPRPVRWM